MFLGAPEEVDLVRGVRGVEGVVPANCSLTRCLFGDGECDLIRGKLCPEWGSVLGLAFTGYAGETDGSSSDATLNQRVVLEAIRVHGQGGHGDDTTGSLPGAAIGGAPVLGPDACVIGITKGSLDLELVVSDVGGVRSASAQYTDVVNPICLERIFATLGNHLARRLPWGGAFRSEDRRPGNGRLEIADVLPDENAAVGSAAFSVHQVGVEAESVDGGEVRITGGFAVEFDC